MSWFFIFLPPISQIFADFFCINSFTQTCLQQAGLLSFNSQGARSYVFLCAIFATLREIVFLRLSA